MSTRAIVRFEGPEGPWSVFVGSDGYPEWLGRHLLDFAAIAPETDPNISGKFPPATPYESAGAMSHAGKLTADFIGYMFAVSKVRMPGGSTVQYHSVALTARDPLQEAAKDWTDIEWLYIVRMKNGRLVILAQKLPIRGPTPATPVPLKSLLEPKREEVTA